MSLTIINSKSPKEVSLRRMETYEKYSRIINWGRQNPVKFASRFMGAELLDLQKYAITNTWTRDFALWLMCRNAGKSIELAIYTMEKSLLFPFHTTYFLGNTGEQAKDTFKKIEKLAKKEIESFSGSTDVFFEEIKKNNIGDGFVHNPASFTCELFNGASVHTLNSDITNIKGKRADLVCFDEAGWFSDELFIQAEQFVNQSENFKLGADIDLNIEPKRFPKQLLYASSASDTSSEFFKKFKTFSQKMIIGDQRYFACNFTIDHILKAKYNGEAYPPLLSQDKVDKAMTDNRDKALRELYNKFSADTYENQLLSRRELRQVTENRLPLLENDTGNRLFVIGWDSGRINDNSVLSIAELFLDPQKGWCMKLQNVISLVDIDSKKKTPKRMPEQVQDFKVTLLKYNGSDKMNLDYENIKALVCDSGAGGNMIGGITDYLLEDWTDSYGVVHKGLIDRSHKSSETAKIKYPNAVDIVKLIDPRAHRNDVFEALEQMIKLGVLTFPVEYEDGKDYIIQFNKENGQEVEEKIKLTFEQQLALAQIELTKSEIVKLCKYTNKGVVSYAYPPEHKNDHDDRLFSISLLAYYLATLRRNTVVDRKPDDSKTFDIGALMRSPSLVKAIG